MPASLKGAMNPEVVATFIPITAIIGAIALIALLAYFRHRATELRHRERVAAMEKGIELPPEPVLGRHAYLLRGLVWLFTGIALSIFLTAFAVADRDRDLYGAAVLGLIPAGVGAAYLIVYRVQSKPTRS